MLTDFILHLSLVFYVSRIENSIIHFCQDDTFFRSLLSYTHVLYIILHLILSYSEDYLEKYISVRNGSKES